MLPQWVPYCGVAPEPAEWLARWNLDPLLLLILGLSFAMGMARLRHDPQRARLFAGGMAVLAVLFVSPLCPLTSALFSARTVHHTLLVALAAPLLAWAMPGRHRSLDHMAPWTIGHTAILWAWHVPALYSTALSNDAVYWLMQISLLGSAIGFWGSVRQSAIISAMGSLLFAMMQMGLLGALLTFAARPLYAPHSGTTFAWALTPLQDQQLAGLIMWAPAAAFYLFAALLLAGRWLQGEGRATALSRQA